MLFMISCKDAGKLVSQQIDQPLRLREKLRLRAHLLMCGTCLNLYRKLNIIHRASQQYMRYDEANENERLNLSHEAKERILNKLRHGN